MYEQRSWLDKWVALESCKSGEILVSAIYKPTLPSRSSSTRFWFLYFSIHVFTVHLYNLFESDGNCIKAVTNMLMSCCYADRLVLCWSVESWPSLSSRPGVVLKENSWVECTRWNKGPSLHNGGLEYLKSTSRNLEKDGLWGKADPYVLLTLGDQKAKSGTVGNTQVRYLNISAWKFVLRIQSGTSLQSCSWMKPPHKICSSRCSTPI